MLFSRIRTCAFQALLSFTAMSIFAATQPTQPFEMADDASASTSTIDKIVLKALRDHSIEPAHLCSDEVFVRRVYLDVIGTMPDAADVRHFLDDRSPAKRAALIETLLNRSEFADYWSMKWCDLLRVKSEFPVNLWPNAVQAYHRWIHNAVRSNMPYDQFARELLTSSGSNFRVPQVNFYRATQGRGEASVADAVALTFMGARADKWRDGRRGALGSFFSRILYKETGEWKEEIVCLNPASTQTLKCTFPDGDSVIIPPDQDPRLVFADWLITSDNPWFTRSIVNRIWSWLVGRGVIHEPDDIRADNPAAIPELLAYLEKELIKQHYDLRHIYRLILNSRTYQQSCIPQSPSPDAERLFAYYSVRRLDAEVLIDALTKLGGSGEGYTSPIPEPFTFIPEHQRAICLADGSISSPFLELFGRPARDTGIESERNNQPTEGQRLHLLNSSDVQRRIQNSEKLRRLMQGARGNRPEMIRQIYLGLLSRFPTKQELATAQKYCQTGGFWAPQDLAWALINTKEFLYRH